MKPLFPLVPPPPIPPTIQVCKAIKCGAPPPQPLQCRTKPEGQFLLSRAALTIWCRIIIELFIWLKVLRSVYLTCSSFLRCAVLTRNKVKEISIQVSYYIIFILTDALLGGSVVQLCISAFIFEV